MSSEITESKPVEYDFNGQMITIIENVSLVSLFMDLKFRGVTKVELYWTPGPNVFSNLGLVTNRVTHIFSDGQLARLEKQEGQAKTFQPLFPEATYIAHLGGEKKDWVRLMTTLLPEEVEDLARKTGFDTTNKLKFQHALDEPME
ncbi:MAG: hypothetical protein MUP45_03600 [Candidatus Marinimicrobia bacterium]|nr:hypothetical protein [Candidatus Neomarinimicrobiota bacterium]